MDSLEGVGGAQEEGKLAVVSAPPSLSSLPAELLPPIFCLAQWPALRQVSKKLWATSKEPRTRALFLVYLKGGTSHVFGPPRPRRSTTRIASWNAVVIPVDDLLPNFGRNISLHPLADSPLVLDVLFRMNANFGPAVLIDAVRLGRRNVVSWFLDGWQRWQEVEESGGAVVPKTNNNNNSSTPAIVELLPEDPDLSFQDAEPPTYASAANANSTTSSSSNTSSSEDLVAATAASSYGAPDDLSDAEARGYLSSPPFLVSLVLTHAVAVNDYNLVSMLFRHPILRTAHSTKKLDTTDALLAAARKGHLGIFRLLLAISSSTAPIPRPNWSGSINNFVRLSNGAIQSSLRSAAARNQPSIVRFLLSLNPPQTTSPELLFVDPNDDLAGTDNPPLSHAAWRGYSDVVKELLKGGARPDNLSLFLASSRGHVDAMRYMVACGARPGEDLLWYSGSRGEESVVKFLVGECGVPVEGCCGMWRVGGRADVANWVERLRNEAIMARKSSVKGKEKVGEEGRMTPPPNVSTSSLSRSSSISSVGSLSRRQQQGNAVDIDSIIDAIVPDAPAGVPSGMFDPQRHSGWFAPFEAREATRGWEGVEGVLDSIEAGMMDNVEVDGNVQQEFSMEVTDEHNNQGTPSVLFAARPEPDPLQHPTAPRNLAANFPELAPPPLMTLNKIAGGGLVSPGSGARANMIGSPSMEQGSASFSSSSAGGGLAAPNPPNIIFTAATPTSASTNNGTASMNREPPQDREAIAAHLVLALPADCKPGDGGAHSMLSNNKKQGKRGEVVYFDDDDDSSGDESPGTVDIVDRLVKPTHKISEWGGWDDGFAGPGWIDVSDEYVAPAAPAPIMVEEKKRPNSWCASSGASSGQASTVSLERRTSGYGGKYFGRETGTGGGGSGGQGYMGWAGKDSWGGW